MSKYRSPNFKKTKTPQYTSSPVGGSKKIKNTGRGFKQNQTLNKQADELFHWMGRKCEI